MIKKNGLLLYLLVLPLFSLTAQEGDMNQVRAQEEFRLGVTAFHAGFYNKAVLALEKSLSLEPEDPLTRSWLARTLYQSGLVDAALYEWDSLIARKAASSSLIQFVDFVRMRYGLAEELREEEPWVPFHHFEGKSGEQVLFHRPSMIVPVKDGSGDLLIASFMTNEIIRMTPNGVITHRFRGGLDGYDHPFGVIPAHDGKFLLSEYKRDMISLCRKTGTREKGIGNSGIADGEFKGPQYLCDSGDGYFYVSDWGNRRVSKFDYEGNFILSLGEFDAGFPGFKGPTGIAVNDGLVYVADVSRKAVYLFDGSGNYLETLIDEGLHGPEGLSFLNGEILLIADTDQLLRYHTVERDLIRVTNLDGEAERLTGVCVDENGYILLSDFNKSRITLLTEVSTLYSGMFVRVDRVDSNRYPEVRVEVTVEDRFGHPVTGLDTSNFVISENAYPAGPFELKRAGFRDSSVGLAIVVDSRFKTVKDQSDRDRAVIDILKLTDRKDFTALVSAGVNPEILSRKGGEFPSLLKKGILPVGASGADDTAFRLAAAELVPLRTRKAVVYVTTGKNNGGSLFERYGLLELAQFMTVNGIRFHVVCTEPELLDEELLYLAETTGGSIQYLYQPAGISAITERLRRESSGNYTLVYKSKARTDFGRAYIPLSVEVLYLKKSGRDESGYFAPGDFNPSK